MAGRKKADCWQAPFLKKAICKVKDDVVSDCKLIFFHLVVIISALQIRASQRSITANIRPFTAHIYHAMIIVARSFSKKYIFY